MRHFRSPGGRQWTADLYKLPKGTAVLARNGAIPTDCVLRFCCKEQTLDLVGFPEDWASHSDAELVRLLEHARTPSFTELKPREAVSAETPPDAKL